MKLLKIKRKIKIKKKNIDDYINKEHAYKLFWGDKYSKNISDNMIRI